MLARAANLIIPPALCFFFFGPGCSSGVVKHKFGQFAPVELLENHQKIMSFYPLRLSDELLQSCGEEKCTGFADSQETSERA